MEKIKLLLITGVIATVSLNAGQIQIGGPNGLTSAYITSGCAAANGPSFTGCATTGGTTVVGTSTVQRSYTNGLFSAVTIPGSVPNGSTNAGANRTPTISDTNANTGGSVLNPVTFALMNDGTNTNGITTDNGIWTVSNGATTKDLTIPVGIYNVDSVWTMINDYWGVVGQSVITVTFNFADDSAGTSGLNQVAVSLTSGVNIRSAVDCTAGNGANSGQGSCPSVGTQGTIAASLTPGTTTPTSGVTVSASQLFSTAYNTTPTAAVPYANTSGNVVLDDQYFQFASSIYLNKYLVSINIHDAGVGQQSRAGVSAITVNTATPEPSSVILLLSGISVLGVGARRRYRRS